MRESRIQAQIIDWLRNQGSYAINIHGHFMQEGGVPDILGSWRGRLLGIEVKVPGEEVEEGSQQEYHLEQIVDAGGIGFCAHSLEEARGTLLSIPIWGQE